MPFPFGGKLLDPEKRSKKLLFCYSEGYIQCQNFFSPESSAWPKFGEADPGVWVFAPKNTIPTAEKCHPGPPDSTLFYGQNTVVYVYIFKGGVRSRGGGRSATDTVCVFAFNFLFFLHRKIEKNA